jgi:hypothetical protein
MTISRGQMNRQLYMGGGIMNAVPRENFFLGKVAKAITKPLKKAAKTVGKIAKSDIGKAALLAAGTYYAGGGNLFGLQRAGMDKFAFSQLPGIGGLFANAAMPGTGEALTGTSPFSKALGAIGIGGGGKAMGSLGKLATLGAVSTFLTKKFGMSPEQAEETLANPESRALYLRRYYQNLNPNAGDEEVEEFVSANVAEYAQGGRIMKAAGDTASMNAMQAAGIEGLPVRQNPKGVKELDLRDTGGFIPPVGIKEKEDDIPAMLSNNEFVMTADAVRGMGGGNVELGAQRMYDQMKMLEAGGKV